ncbi:unnamed protein product [Adineta steineri]|uniref:Uncharacterized protein n=1 Tax=Adineta steineri TaxID=433720 RepID=A0A819ZB95_9BILA|nr:unnamed protein product [Adineta steineri]
MPYLSGWHDMRQQVNDDRRHARQLLYISQEIIKLKLRLDEELSHINYICNHNHPWLDENSLIEIMRRINYEIDSEKDSRQKLASYRSDILLAEEHLNEYRMSHFDGPSSSNIDEHLHSCRLALEQLTDNHCECKLDLYKKMLNDFFRKSQSKHVSFDGSINFNNNNSSIFHTSTPQEFNQNIRQKKHRRTTLNDINRNFHNETNSNKQSSTSSYISDDCKVLYIETVVEVTKPVFYERTNDTTTTTNTEYHHHQQQNSQSAANKEYHETINKEYHQNPRSTINKEYHQTSQPTISKQYHETINKEYHQTPQPTISKEYHQNSQSKLNKEYQQYHQTSQPTLNKEYHQTPLSTMNTEYHHQIPQSKINTQRSTNSYYKLHDSSDDDESQNKPVNLSKTANQRNKVQQFDSGIEYDRTSPPPSSSSSTIFTQRTLNDHSKLLFPPASTTSILDETSQSTLVQRLHSTKPKIVNDEVVKSANIPRINSYWNRLKQTWFRSLLLGLLILFILFFVYFNRLDTCSRSIIIRTVFRKIICIEHEGLPTI